MENFQKNQREYILSGVEKKSLNGSGPFYVWPDDVDEAAKKAKSVRKPTGRRHVEIERKGNNKEDKKTDKKTDKKPDKKKNNMKDDDDKDDDDS